MPSNFNAKSDSSQESRAKLYLQLIVDGFKTGMADDVMIHCSNVARAMSQSPEIEKAVIAFLSNSVRELNDD